MGVISSKGELFNREWRKWADATLKRNHERVIFTEEGYFWEYKKKSKYSTIRLLKSTTPTSIVTFGNHTALILRYKEPIRVLLINDDMMLQTFISLFEQLWAIAKEP